MWRLIAEIRYHRVSRLYNYVFDMQGNTPNSNLARLPVINVANLTTIVTLCCFERTLGRHMNGFPHTHGIHCYYSNRCQLTCVLSLFPAVPLATCLLTSCRYVATPGLASSAGTLSESEWLGNKKYIYVYERITSHE